MHHNINRIYILSMRHFAAKGRPALGKLQLRWHTNETRPNHFQISVWRWSGNSLSLEQSQELTICEGVYAWYVGTADLDKDGAREIATIGCISTNNICDRDMRI
ncbi:MAG: hypothetical protein QXL10_03145 [Candidatus Bathyarchaeia archaeon]